MLVEFTDEQITYACSRDHLWHVDRATGILQGFGSGTGLHIVHLPDCASSEAKPKPLQAFPYLTTRDGQQVRLEHFSVFPTSPLFFPTLEVVPETVVAAVGERIAARPLLVLLTPTGRLPAYTFTAGLAGARATESGWFDSNLYVCGFLESLSTSMERVRAFLSGSVDWGVMATEQLSRPLSE